MKKVFKKSIVVVMFFTVLCSYASDFSSLRNRKDGKTTLYLNNVVVGEELIIKNNLDAILYKELITESGNYTKVFDLTELPDGNYSFELNEEIQIKITPFVVKLNKVIFDKDNQFIIYKPFVISNDSYINLSMINTEKKPVEVNLYYDFGSEGFKLIHSQTIENENVINKLYKILGNTKGDFKLKLKTKDRTFVENISI